MKSNSIKDGVFSARTNELRNSQIAYELPPTRLASLLHSLMQWSHKSDTAQVGIPLAACQRFAELRTSDNGPGWLNTLSANPTKRSNTLKKFAWVVLTILWGWHLKGQHLLSSVNHMFCKNNASRSSSSDVIRGIFCNFLLDQFQKQTWMFVSRKYQCVKSTKFFCSIFFTYLADIYLFKDNNRINTRTT